MKFLSCLVIMLCSTSSGMAQQKEDSTDTVQHPAQFPGGRTTWISYIQRSLDRTAGI
jgi:hypothetical protein